MIGGRKGCYGGGSAEQGGAGGLAAHRGTAGGGHAHRLVAHGYTYGRFAAHGYVYNWLAAHGHAGRLAGAGRAAGRLAGAGHAAGSLAARGAAGVAHGGVGLGWCREEGGDVCRLPPRGPLYPGCGRPSDTEAQLLTSSWLLSSCFPSILLSWDALPCAVLHHKLVWL